MARLSAGGVGNIGARASWEMRRLACGFMRRYGPAGWVVLACLITGALALAAEQRELRVLTDTTAQLVVEQRRVPHQRLSEPIEDDGRARLRQFEAQLLAHEDIPHVVRDLMILADEAGLSIVRGEYRPQADVQGGFLRYRMTLPVRGEAQAVYGYIQAALNGQRMLALESVQFKRESIDAPDVEARIQWVVLTRLPKDGHRLKVVEQGGPE